MSTTMHDATRTRLLEAAGHVFAEHGFERATIREICGRAKANIALVKYYFGGKDGLYADVLAHGARQSINAFPPDLGLSATPSPEDRLHAFIHSFLCRLLKTDQQAGWYATLCAQEMIVPTAALNRVVQDVIRPLAERLNVIVKQLTPKASAEQIRRCSLSIVGQCLFYRHSRPVIERLYGVQRYADADITRLADHITQFSLAALRPGTRRAANTKKERALS